VNLSALLLQPMTGADGLDIIPLSEAHREDLRACCAKDQDIWEIYPYSMIGDYFDPAFAITLHTPGRLGFAILKNNIIIGTSSYFLDAVNAVAEIGGTYIEPIARGTGLNKQIKILMLTHAFNAGIAVVRFKVDTRNKRSQAAVLKLGAKHEGILRGDRVIWTGYRRDTAVFSILAHEWPSVRAELLALKNV
jgi:RimJ/RimL family protein N-acetyltransferase